MYLAVSSSISRPKVSRLSDNRSPPFEGGRAPEAPTRTRSRLGSVIARYSRPAMAKIWSDEGKLQAWLEVELAATAAWAELGVVPPDAARTLAGAARVPAPERVAELEATLHHDTAAFVDAVAEQLGE